MRACASNDLRDRIFSPLALSGTIAVTLCFSSPGFQRLDGRDQHLVGHRAAGAEHLRAADRDALAVLVAHAGDEELVRLLRRRSLLRSACGLMMT